MKPISFTPEVLRAKLAVLNATGLCQTRRPVKWPEWISDKAAAAASLNATPKEKMGLFVDGLVRKAFGSPYGPPGSLLWIRERAMVLHAYATKPYEPDNEVVIQYALDGLERTVPWPARLTWVPVPGRCIPNGVHKEGARPFLLEVVDVRVQLLQEITESDARAEGFAADDISRVGIPAFSARQHFETTWDSIYGGTCPWDEDPWTWVYTLKRASSETSPGMGR